MRTLLMYVLLVLLTAFPSRALGVGNNCTEDFEDDVYGEEIACGSPSYFPKLVNVRKIIRGVEAVNHSWPWQVSVFIDGEHECGGTLVNETFVLTAAHCTPDHGEASAMMVVLGAHNIMIEESQREEIQVYRIIRHPKYYADMNSFDIALLELDTAATFTKEIQPICLPASNQIPPAGSTCFITGWGAVKDRDDAVEGDGSDMSDVLLQAPTTILSPQKCESFFGESILPDLVICGTSTRGDTCQGDSGGPLQCKSENGKWYLAGITSWGWKCGKGTPAVYTRVSKYLDWYEIETS